MIPVLTATDLVMDYSARSSAAPTNREPVVAVPAPSFHTLALNHVNFQLNAGESVAVMGPSGSGKSTLLHALAGVIQPTSGSVVFRGADITRMNDADRTALRRTAFGFVFQSGQLLPELPAVENIALPMMLSGVDYRQATDTAILWLERLGLRALATQRPGEMSGGQMQRIAIARALAMRPAVVFADEPTGALDQTTGREVMGILTQAARDNGSSVVVVTHDPNVAAFCGRTVTMQDGVLTAPQGAAGGAVGAVRAAGATRGTGAPGAAGVVGAAGIPSAAVMAGDMSTTTGAAGVTGTAAGMPGTIGTAGAAGMAAGTPAAPHMTQEAAR